MRPVLSIDRPAGFQVLAVPVLEDNFAFILHRDGVAAVVDPGEAGPVVRELDARGLRPAAVFVTHSHADHTGGCRGLLDRYGVTAFSPGREEEREIRLPGIRCVPLDTPGHTTLHTAWYFPEAEAVFTGDLLINGACGRIFGGTPEALFRSLRRIAALPPSTRVFGGHDYLAENLRFARAVEPDNPAIARRERLYAENPAEALFPPLSVEQESNPFLHASDVETLARLRRRKDRFG